jgi:hypothetical protein
MGSDFLGDAPFEQIPPGHVVSFREKRIQQLIKQVLELDPEVPADQDRERLIRIQIAKLMEGDE